MECYQRFDMINQRGLGCHIDLEHMIVYENINSISTRFIDVQLGRQFSLGNLCWRMIFFNICR